MIVVESYHRGDLDFNKSIRRILQGFDPVVPNQYFRLLNDIEEEV